MSNRPLTQAPKQEAASPPRSFRPADSQGANQWSSGDALLQMQRTIGNQAMLKLFESGAIQAKLRISQPGDADEVEADRIADQIVSPPRGPILQRKCACAGSSSACSQCSEEEGVIHRSVTPRLMRSPARSIQRAANKGSGPVKAEGGEKAGTPKREGTQHRSWIVEDDAAALKAGQMKKSEFLQTLRSTVCTTADAILASVGRTTKSCPYVEQWLDFYTGESSEHIESALHKYVPESARVASAQQYFPLIKGRVSQAVRTWVKTGQVTGVPPGVSLTPEVASLLKTESKSGAGGHSGPAPPAKGHEKVQRKQRGAETTDSPDVETIQAQLGSGMALDGVARSRMESAFGQNFSRVRIHTGIAASELSTKLNARAFTVGGDIAFASGEYNPGTPIGDALIAHELAHVVQQGGGNDTSPPMRKGEGDYNSLEEDADRSAIGAVASLWAGARGKLSDIGRNAKPSLRSGLKLQRCQEVKKRCPKGYSWRVLNTTGLGSFGCACHWKCLPGEPVAPSQYDEVRCPSDMNCSSGVKYEDLDSSYTKTGHGAALTPLGEQAYCGCFPLNFEGETVSDAPLKATDFEMTDVVGPLADIAAARGGGSARTDPKTGKRLPGEEPSRTGPPPKSPAAIHGDLGVDVAAGNARVADYRTRFNAGKNRNVAFADIDVTGKKGTAVAISGEAERAGTVPTPKDARLPNLIVGFPRQFDAEKKILEHVATELGDNPGATGTINLFSERPVCPGCDIAISQFRQKYPKITVKVVAGSK